MKPQSNAPTTIADRFIGIEAHPTKGRVRVDLIDGAVKTTSITPEEEAEINAQVKRDLQLMREKQAQLAEAIRIQNADGMPEFLKSEAAQLEILLQRDDHPVPVRKVHLCENIGSRKVPTAEVLEFIGRFVSGDYGDETAERWERNAKHLTVKPEDRDYAGWGISAIYVTEKGHPIRVNLDSKGIATVWVETNWNVEAKRPHTPGPLGNGNFAKGATMPDPEIVAELEKESAAKTVSKGVDAATEMTGSVFGNALNSNR